MCTLAVMFITRVTRITLNLFVMINDDYSCANLNIRLILQIQEFLDSQDFSQLGQIFVFLFVQLKHCKIPTNISQTDIFLEFRKFDEKMYLR